MLELNWFKGRLTTLTREGGVWVGVAMMMIFLSHIHIKASQKFPFLGLSEQGHAVCLVISLISVTFRLHGHSLVGGKAKMESQGNSKHEEKRKGKSPVLNGFIKFQSVLCPSPMGIVARTNPHSILLPSCTSPNTTNSCLRFPTHIAGPKNARARYVLPEN